MSILPPNPQMKFFHQNQRLRIILNNLGNFHLPRGLQSFVRHISTNPRRWRCKMIQRIDPAQNFFSGDRWSPIWCSEVKIPRFLQKSAPPVASEVGTPLTRKIASKLTSNYEGLSFGPAKKQKKKTKNPHWSHKKFLIFWNFSE